MRVKDKYKKDASAGKFKKFGVEADITITADHLKNEEELVEICKRVRDAIEEEVIDLENDLKEEKEEAKVSD